MVHGLIGITTNVITIHQTIPEGNLSGYKGLFSFSLCPIWLDTSDPNQNVTIQKE